MGGTASKVVEKEAEREAEGQAERGAEEQAEGQAERQAEREAEREAEKAAEKAAERKAGGVASKAASVISVVAAVAAAIMGVIAELAAAASAAAGAGAAIFAFVVSLLVMLGGLVSFLYTKGEGHPVKQYNDAGFVEAEFVEGSSSSLGMVGVVLFIIIFGAVAVAIFIWVNSIEKPSLLREQLREYLDENSLSMVQAGLAMDTSSDERCSELNSSISPGKVTCDSEKCILNKESTRCISCKEWLKSLDPDNDDDDDDEETMSTIEKYALYGILVKKAYSKIAPKFIKSRVASAFTKVGSGAMRLVKELILKLIAKSYEEMAERAISEAAAASEVLEAEGTILAGAAETGPLDVAIGVGMALVDILMIEGMIADAIDISSYRSYISNTNNLTQRNKMDSAYLRSIAINHNITDSTIPPISDQKPSMYQLETMVYPLKNSKIPEANTLLIIGEAYTEAKIAWLIEVLNLTPDEITATKDSNFITAHDDFVRIQKKGNKAGYLPISVDEDIELQFSNKNFNSEVSNYPSHYIGGFCKYEIDSYEYLDKFINSRPSVRDTYFLKYIQEYMEKYVSIDTVYNNLKNNTDDNSENLWDSPLPNEGSNMISYHAPPSRIYKASDLIKDYGNGTTKISGISLTEVGCILLNQILDYESYIYPYRKRILNKDPMFPLPNSVKDDDLQDLKSYLLPKVVYSEYHRVIVAGTGDKHKIISISNSPVASQIKLPLYYPSTTMNEMSCKYGYQALKAGNKDTDDYKSILALDFMAKGTGGDEDDISNTLVEGGDPWLPLLYGVSFDTNIGLCKYETRGTSFTDESYCTRMGRTTTSQVYENPGRPGNRGQKYTICDESECDDIGCFIIGEEHEHDWDRYTTDIGNIF